MDRPPDPVPRDYALLYAFANSLDERRFVEEGAAHQGGDDLATAAGLQDWLRRHGLAGEDRLPDAAAHRRALALRAAVRALLRAAPGDRRSADIAALLNRAAGDFPLAVAMGGDGTIALVPAAGASGLAAVPAELQRAAWTGDLDRLKMCASEDCRWVFFDRSKPGTRRWCASALCGNRQKTKTYRERKRQRRETGA